MSSCESVYATSSKGYIHTQRSSDDPSIIRAKERNILLQFVRCNEIYKGPSYFKSKKQQEYYQSYCRSAPSRKTTKSFMFKSDLTNGSSIPEDKALSKLNELNAQMNRKKERSQLFESSDDIYEKIQREKCLSARKEYRIEVEEEEKQAQKKKESQNTPKFVEKKFEFKEKGEEKQMKDKKYISDYNIMKSSVNQEQSEKIKMKEETENSPHQLKIHLPYRLNSHKKPSECSSPFEYQNQLQKLKKNLQDKKKEVEGYKAELQESRRKENDLLTQLNQLRHEQTVMKGCQNGEKMEKMEKGCEVGMVQMTFLLILLVKMKFQN